MPQALPPLIVTLAATTPLSLFAQAELPPPTGPAAVGTVTYEWVDSTRAEVVEFFARDTASGRLAPVPARGARRLVVQLWYPAAASGGRGRRAPYNRDIDAFAPVMRDSARVALYRTTAAHAVAWAPPTPGRMPVLVFSPGGGTFRSDYTAVCEDLASHGYVVVAVSHPGVTLMSLDDGRIGTEWSGWRPPPELSMSLERDSLRASVEFFGRGRDRYTVGDIRFVLDRLYEVDRGAEGGRFAGRLELSRVGAFGHSTGGAVVAAAAHADQRIKAVLVYDVILPRVVLGEELEVPVMLLRTDDTRYPPGWSELQAETFAHVRAPGYDVVLHGGGHNSFSDRAVLTPERYRYRLDAARGMEVVRQFSRAFFDAQLLGRSSGLLREGNTPAEVTLTVHATP